MNKKKKTTELSPTPRFNSRKMICMILAAVFMMSMLSVTCFAAGTGGTTDMWTKASEIMKDVYGKVIGITAIQQAQATELANAKDAAKSALDTEEAKDSLTDKTPLTTGKSNIDNAKTKAEVESAKNAAITAIHSAQKSEHEELISPQTGDTGDITLWLVLFALSFMGFCACLVLGIKRKNEQ